MLLAVTYVIHPAVTAIIAVISGILILVFPRLLNIVVGLYLILIGLLGLAVAFR